MCIRDRVPFVEGECGLIIVTGSLGDTQQFKIGLKKAVFPGRNMNGVKNAVEGLFSVFGSYGKVISIYRRFFALVVNIYPFIFIYVDTKGIELIGIQIIMDYATAF